MLKDDLIKKNLRVLFSLRDGPATLDEIADKAKYRRGSMDIPLRILTEQGLIGKDGDRYVLKDGYEQVFSLIDPWLSYHGEQYGDIARDVADIILRHSRLDAGVQDVLLYGSVLHGDEKPNDIDMVILHNGRRLQEFERDPYDERTSWVSESDAPVGEGNKRTGSFRNLWMLGYRGPVRQAAWGDRLIDDAEDRDGSLFKNESALAQVLNRLAPLGFHPLGTAHTALYGQQDELNAILDLHAISTNLFEKNWGYARQQAIDNCRKPDYWHSVLTKGRLYDQKTNEFSIPVDEKYPGASELFRQ